MFKCVNVIVFLIAITVGAEGGRILAVFPGPSISHQLVFRPFTQELARRGHDVVVITTDPAFPKGAAPPNLTEIDVKDISYSIYRKTFSRILTGHSNVRLQLKVLIEASIEVFIGQIQSDVIQQLINDKEQKFDLVIAESYFRISAVFSYIFKTPVILLSSFGFGVNTAQASGAPIHPLYPSSTRQRITNLTSWEKITELYREISDHRLMYSVDSIEEEVMEKYIPGSPKVKDIVGNIHTQLLNVHALWEFNRPTPPGAVFLGSLLHKPETDLPQDLLSYLDSSKHGAIYISFGTNVIESLLPTAKIQMFIKVLSELPYNVIWKWGSSNVPKSMKNIKFYKWVPQPILLKHPNIKLFITQGGLQSTDEAIAAEVPLIGIPMSLDQWFNVEHYIHYNIGLKLVFESVTEEEFRSAVETVINDTSYQRNVARLRSLMHDQPQRPLERAVWWTEHVLRHGGGKHLRAPAADLSLAEYLELELLFIVMTLIFIILCFLVFGIAKLLRFIKKIVKFVTV